MKQCRITTQFLVILALFLRLWSLLELFGDLKMPYAAWDRFFKLFL